MLCRLLGSHICIAEKSPYSPEATIFLFLDIAILRISLLVGLLKLNFIKIRHVPSSVFAHLILDNKLLVYSQ